MKYGLNIFDRIFPYWNSKYLYLKCVMSFERVARNFSLEI